MAVIARMGTFAGASEEYGRPLSFIHPKDNDFQKARFHPILLDPRLNLTNKQRRKLQEQIDDLAGLGKLARERAIANLIKKRNQNKKKPPKYKKHKHTPAQHRKHQRK